MSGYFKPEPKLTLHGEAELREALNNPTWCHGDLKWETYSDFIAACIDEITARGEYPYNATVNQLVSEKLGLPKHDYSIENTPLSALVYNAQCYHHSDTYRKQGYEPLTQALADRAFAQKAKIEILGSNILCQDVQALCNVRKIGDRVYVTKPRARSYAISLQGQPARIVK